MKNIWTVDVESKEDPYGAGPGYRFLVFAESKEAASKVVKRHINRTKHLRGWGDVFKIKHTPKAVLS